MWITYFAGTLFASSWGAVAFMSIWSRRITASAAFWGIVVGFVVNIVANFLRKFGMVSLPVYLDPFIIGSVLSLLTILLVSRGGTVSHAERSFLARIRQTPAEECNAAALSGTLLVPRLMMVSGVLIAAFLINYYAIPYSQALGQP
ncbi:hypothetical protein D3C78_1219150 [compost metagenome]